MKPVLYILQPIGVDRQMEAIDILWFCSEECRGVIAANTEHTVKPGLSAEYISDTVCDECGKPLRD